MIICSCKRVSEREIANLAEARRREGPVRLGDAVRELGVGTGCGRCLRHARCVMDAVVAEREPDVLLPKVLPWSLRVGAG